MKLKIYLLILFCIYINVSLGQIYLADNGLSITGTGVNKKVRLGGSLLLNTSFDLGATFTYNIKKGTANYLHILNNGNIGFGTNAPTAQLHSTGSIRFGGLLNDNSAPRVIASDINGNLSWRDVSTLGGGSTAITASNGLTKTGNEISLGGTLTKRTKIEGSFRTLITDTLALSKDLFIYRTPIDSSRFFRLGMGRDYGDTTSTIIGRSAGVNISLDGTQKNNVYIGNHAGLLNLTGATNTVVGSLAHEYNNTGQGNTVVGYQALRYSTGNTNTGLGYSAGVSLSAGTENLFVGYASGPGSINNLGLTMFGNVGLGSFSLSNGKSDSNVAVGRGAIRGGSENPETGVNTSNVAIGFGALSANMVGSKYRNVALGHLAARDFTGSNQLFIENSESPTPLIHGDFEADTLRFNGKVSIRDVDSSNSPQNMLYVTKEGRIMKSAISSGGSSNWNLAGNNIVNTNTGFVSIGTSANPAPSDPQLKLAVNGNIYAQKLKITQQGWADYVFEPTYKLMPLSELEAYINKNKHLPDVPSATDVETKGLDLGDNQTILLKKIEELTLYVIELKKEIDSLKVEKTIQSKKK